MSKIDKITQETKDIPPIFSHAKIDNNLSIKKVIENLRKWALVKTPQTHNCWHKTDSSVILSYLEWSNLMKQSLTL